MPENLILTLSLAVFFSGVSAIAASYRRGGRTAFLLLKPLTTSLILLIALVGAAGPAGSYAWLVTAGLFFALLGDVLLMLPDRYFSFGILAFAVTHLLYFVAFYFASGLALSHPVTVALGAVALLLARTVWGGVPAALRLPVAAYVLLITAMTAQAVGAALRLSTISTSLAATGAALFFLSDAILAVDRFRLPLVAGRAVVLSSYWAGQLLIALSTR